MQVTGKSVTLSFDDTKPYTKMEYSSGKIIYKGTHSVHGASDNDPYWEITKYTWVGDDLTVMEVLTGSYTNRESLSWA